VISADDAARCRAARASTSTHARRTPARATAPHATSATSGRYKGVRKRIVPGPERRGSGKTAIVAATTASSGQAAG
jgi:hypothetical protein